MEKKITATALRMKGRGILAQEFLFLMETELIDSG